jgi:hypothetical protein
LTILRWVHERLGVMGYEPTDEHDEQHPTAWWEARRKRWAQALEAQAQLLSDAWDEHSNMLGVISCRQGRA